MYLGFLHPFFNGRVGVKEAEDEMVGALNRDALGGETGGRKGGKEGRRGKKK